MSLDATLIKGRTQFYKTIVVLNLVRSIIRNSLNTRLRLPCKLYFIIILFLSNQENFMVSVPKIENYLKKVLLKSKLDRNYLIGDASIVFKGWRANKRNQIAFKSKDQMEHLKLKKTGILRLDVKRVFPTLTLFSGFETEKILLNSFVNSKLFASQSNNGYVSIAGQFNLEVIDSLRINSLSKNTELDLKDVIYIDDVKIYSQSNSVILETLMFIVINQISLHGLLIKCFPLDLLKYVANELLSLRNLKSVALFESSLLGSSNKSANRKVEKLTYSINSKSKTEILPSVIRNSSVTIYPENILVDSNGYLINEIPLDPRYNFISHLSNFLYCHELSGDEVFIYHDNCEIIKIEESVIYLPCNAVSNWFHLIFEGLLPLIANLDNIRKTDKILIHPKSPKQFKELLQIFGFNDFYELDNSKIYNLELLVRFESATLIYDSLSHNQDINRFSISKSALLIVQQFIQERMALSDFKEYILLPKKLLVLRNGSTRGLTNRKEVEDFYVSKGFCVIISENLAIVDQINYFLNADEIVLEGGAVMANLIFCREGTKITYLCSNITSDFNLIADVCNSLGLDLDIIAGEPASIFKSNYSSIYDIFHSNYRINPKLLKSF